MELKQALTEIFEYLKQDCGYLGFPEFVEDPGGQRQDSDCGFFEYEWVDQTTGISGDDHSGSIYFPFEDYYIKVDFAM